MAIPEIIPARPARAAGTAANALLAPGCTHFVPEREEVKDERPERAEVVMPSLAEA